MTPDEERRALERDSARLRHLISEGDLTAPVPGCPRWNLADLGSHVGSAFRFGTASIEGRREPDEPEGPREPPALLEWYDDGWSALVQALESHDLKQSCWTLGPPEVVGFWLRRMCLETAIHLWDAQASLGAPAALDPQLAADGVREVLSVFVPRQVRLQRMKLPRGSLRLEMTDTDDQPLVLSGADVTAGSPVGEVIISGPASSLLLLLWRRTRLKESGVSVTGDDAIAVEMLQSALTP